VIRQAISCDLCGTEKKQTNHWFVAYDQGGELRVSGWNSRNRQRPGSMHLCGQTCLHKLVDDFMARALLVRSPAKFVEEIDAPSAATDKSGDVNAPCIEIESSARLLTPHVSASSKPYTNRAKPELVAMQGRVSTEDKATGPDDPPRIASRNWRAEAWDRERERASRGLEQRTERRPDKTARRRFGS
jgi:hypothetical protein